MNNQLKNQHLLWRAGFGPKASELDRLADVDPEKTFERLAKSSAVEPVAIDVADNVLKNLVMNAYSQDRTKKKELSVEERKILRVQTREDLKKLNLAWLDQMVNSDMQLKEKMAFFWHGHFASRNINIFFQQQLLDVIRKNALGSFKDLLFAVSKSASMINFLNNNQNRKDHPNENFAREVMELFTMGRGFYTEQDIKEAARAFTGWGANAQGEFTFRKNQHDFGNKTFLGKSGNFSGDDVLNMLLEQKQTAVFITQKIYRYFVNDTVDKSKVEWLSNRFYQSGYDIQGLMKDIFTGDWFYDQKNIGAKIKSPVELVVGIRRILPMQIENAEIQLLVQKVLGQTLFYPPNVAGWPGGKNWIDSSSLMFRLRLPQLINDADAFSITPKDDDDQMMGMKDRDNTMTAKRSANKKPGQQIKASINWQDYMQRFEKVSREKLETDIAAVLLQTSKPVDVKVAKQYADASSRERFIKTVTIQIMSTPEYQLC